MNNKEHIVELLKSWLDKKQIQFNEGRYWIDVNIEDYLSELINYPGSFRVKPSCNTFDDASQFIKALNDHGGFIRHRKTKTVSFPIYSCNTYVIVPINNKLKKLTYTELFSNYEFFDNTEIAG